MEEKMERILFVHKDDELFEYAFRHLSQDNFKVIRVNDGEDATISLLSEDVTVIVTDAKADKLNSVDLIDIVDARHSDVPVIVLADEDSMEVVAQALKRGAFDYLKMPFDGYDLVRTVRRAVDFRNEKLAQLEKEIKKRKEVTAQQSQSEITSILTSIIPSILLPSSQEVKTRFIKEMCDSIEKLYCDKYVSKGEEVDSERVAEVVQLVFNQLGASFKVVEVTPQRILIETKTCPWGGQAKENPVLCMLTRAIASRIAVRCRSCAMVLLEKTIGNGDDSCLIRIENLQ